MSSRLHALPRLNRRITLPGTASLLWPLAAIALMLGLHLSNALGRAINWDEFYHYTQIHELLRGALTSPLQTLQARAFGWITLLPFDNIGQIVAARVGMFVCMLVAAGAIYATAQGLAGRSAALLAALGWLSAGFVLQHATSYRPDALAAALLMLALALMTRSSLGLRVSLLIAALAALALLVTMKSALYAPAFAGIAWLRWQEAGRTREAGLRLALLAVLVPGLFALFYLAHAAGLPPGQAVAEMASSSAGQMFQPFTFPYRHHAAKAAMTAPVLTLAIALLPVLAWRARQLSGAEKAALAGLALPLTTILFYHNSAAYFYVFILPPVAVACVVSWEMLERRYSLAAVSTVLALAALAVFATEERENLAKQRRIVAAADQIFAQPVAYFDFPGMIGHFPKANRFLTPWGVANYRRDGAAGSMAAIMARRPVPLVLENDPMLTAALTGDGRVPELQPGDVAALRDSYVRFWGPYWLAGMELTAGTSRNAMIRVPGDYTVRDGAMVVNGLLYLPGEVLQLPRGRAQVTAAGEPARLLWGDRLEAPDLPPPTEPWWTLF